MGGIWKCNKLAATAQSSANGSESLPLAFKETFWAPSCLTPQKDTQRDVSLAPSSSYLCLSSPSHTALLDTHLRHPLVYHLLTVFPSYILVYLLFHTNDFLVEWTFM